MADLTRINAALSLDGLGDDARAAFDLAAQAGYGGVAIPTNHPQMRPAELGTSAIRHLQRTLEGRHLTVASLRVAAPRGGLMESATIDRTMDNTRAALRLAFEMGVGTVSLNVGVLGAKGKGKLPPEALLAAARELAEEADRAGVTLALGADGSDALLELLHGVAYERARANLDPAGLVAAGEDPLGVAEKMAGTIGQWTAGDAVRTGKQARLVELGEGQVPMEELAELLREQGFPGPVVVDVRDLANGPAGARTAARVLRGLLPPTKK